MNVVEKTGKTVEEAVAAALEELGVTQQDVDVEILEEARRGILGIGSRDAKVRLTVRGTAPAEAAVAEAEMAEPAPETTADTPEETAQETDTPQEQSLDAETERQAVASAAKSFLEALFQAMEMDLIIEKFVSHKEDAIILKLHGEGIGVLIGKHGQTLDALQYLTNLAANKGRKGWNRVILDAENYRQRRRQTLERLAQNLADRVKRTGRKAMLEPMNPYERKIVHVSLQNDPQITTYSEGEEPYRKVVIDLK